MKYKETVPPKSDRHRTSRYFVTLLKPLLVIIHVLNKAIIVQVNKARSCYRVLGE